jgi:hypothetical protein
MFPRTFQLALAGALICPSSLVAQMPAMRGMHHNTPVSAAARRQIDSVVKAVVPLGLPGAAANAGFRPAFGWIPTMGEHWVSRAQMVNGRQTDRAKPSQLMFSTIAGKDSLVGAAYAYVTVVGDTVRPVLFDGAPPWHEHRDLAPEGMTLVMLHVWFVPSPDGPFAGTNPNLPFWALGLDAPSPSRMRDSAFRSRVYRASLALAEVADTTSILATLKSRPEVRAAIDAHRDTVRSLVTALREAQKAKNTARWDRTLEKTARQWDAIQATYVSSARTTDGRRRIEQFIAMVLGQHTSTHGRDNH